MIRNGKIRIIWNQFWFRGGIVNLIINLSNDYSNLVFKLFKYCVLGIVGMVGISMEMSIFH